MRKPIVHTDHSDNATRTCPCGASITISVSTPFARVARWMATHAPHSNGVMRVIVDGSWSRFFTTRPDDYEVRL